MQFTLFCEVSCSWLQDLYLSSFLVKWPTVSLTWRAVHFAVALLVKSTYTTVTNLTYPSSDRSASRMFASLSKRSNWEDWLINYTKMAMPVTEAVVVVLNLIFIGPKKLKQLSQQASSSASAVWHFLALPASSLSSWSIFSPINLFI